MKDTVVLALDPGVTTGWALLGAQERNIIGMGDLDQIELGCALDLLVRAMHRLDNYVLPVVEDLPHAGGTKGQLANTLEFVNRTIDFWLIEVFELPVVYVPPSRWKTSRVAVTLDVDLKTWNGMKTSQHMRDAYTMGCYLSEINRQGEM